MFSVVWIQTCYWKAEYNQQQNKVFSEMKTLKEKRNRASSCSSYLRVLHKKREHATAQRPDQECQERHQVNSSSELFLFRRNSREGEIKTEGEKKALSSLYKHLFTDHEHLLTQITWQCK